MAALSFEFPGGKVHGETRLLLHKLAACNTGACVASRQHASPNLLFTLCNTGSSVCARSLCAALRQRGWSITLCRKACALSAGRS